MAALIVIVGIFAFIQFLLTVGGVGYGLDKDEDIPLFYGIGSAITAVICILIVAIFMVYAEIEVAKKQIRSLQQDLPSEKVEE